jgi:hypothetical protein
MLIERTFAVGGVLCIVLGALLAAAFLSAGGLALLAGAVLGPVLLIGFGGFFLYVARQARQDRQRLLALAESPPPTEGQRPK